MNARMGQITEEDSVYQATVKEAGKYSKKLNTLKLPRETTQLIDRYVNAQTEQGSRYGDLAYILGFSDCIELLLDKERFPCADEHLYSKSAKCQKHHEIQCINTDVEESNQNQ